MRRLLLALLLATNVAVAQSAATPSDPLAPLNFLLGTWSASASPAAGSAGAAVTGTYTFRTDLNGHVLSRTSAADSCKAPTSFDCQHHDMLTVFAAPHAPLSALYLDSEGHVIHYTVSLPDPHTVVFDSAEPPAAPKFRLTYHLEGSGPNAVMTGKFQMAAPGSNDFHSYLEWSGTKQ
jgi:hypothetical protein